MSAVAELLFGQFTFQMELLIRSLFLKESLKLLTLMSVLSWVREKRIAVGVFIDSGEFFKVS